MATRLALLLVALLSAVAQSYKLPSRLPKTDSRCSRRREVIGGAMLVGWQLLGAPALAADSDAAREAAAAFASLSPAELRKLQADADKQGYKDLCQFYLSRYNLRIDFVDFEGALSDLESADEMTPLPGDIWTPGNTQFS